MCLCVLNQNYSMCVQFMRQINNDKLPHYCMISNSFSILCIIEAFLYFYGSNLRALVKHQASMYKNINGLANKVTAMQMKMIVDGSQGYHYDLLMNNIEKSDEWTIKWYTPVRMLGILLLGLQSSRCYTAPGCLVDAQIFKIFKRMSNTCIFANSIYNFRLNAVWMKGKTTTWNAIFGQSKNFKSLA